MSNNEHTATIAEARHDLMHLLSHTPDGAELFDVYLEEAELAGDTDLVAFFRQSRGLKTAPRQVGFKHDLA